MGYLDLETALVRNFLLATVLVTVSSAAVAQSTDPIVAYKLNGLGYLVGVRASGTLTSAGITSPPPALSFETPLAGAGSPSGSSGQVQYNNGGAFGAYTNAQLTALIQTATISASGAVPAGGGTGKAWNPVDGWYTTGGGGGSGITGLAGDVTTPASSSGNGVVSTLASVGTAGTYGAVTTDAKGRVTSGQAVTPIANGGTGVSSAFQTLTYAATIAENVALGGVATVTLTGNPTFACPTNMIAGGTYQTRFVQDATGSRVWTAPSCFKWPGGTVGVLSTAANAIDVVTFTSFDGSTATAVISKAFQ